MCTLLVLFQQKGNNSVRPTSVVHFGVRFFYFFEGGGSCKLITPPFLKFCCSFMSFALIHVTICSANLILHPEVTVIWQDVTIQETT